ncbi:MAG: hypothetical protein WBE06_08880 [Phycisphaerae bacterium]
MRTRLAQKGWMLPVCLWLLCAPVASAATNVAVFNFQMTSGSPDWRWLEKGLADRIATDFVQSRGLSVVARDEMQLVAQKMNWVPEMATTDAARMDEIRKSLKIEQLISGVYAVADGRIRITGQIVDVESRMELARKEVEGPVEQVLDLQRQLSAELLGWFTQRPPAEILETLPVWTRSLPAAKALYEGMDLYDQGRYGEGWLRFRQASRDDPQYVEAVYWVGKMYYFMNRYEHARRSLERFVYMDMAHPRLGDAMVEYVHTYESTPDVSADALLRMYEDMGRRFPNAAIWQGSEWGYFGKWRAGEWLLCKRVHLLAQVGRHEEAVRLSGPVLHSVDWSIELPMGWAVPYGLQNLLEHHARTAALPVVPIQWCPGFSAGETWMIPDPLEGSWLEFDLGCRPQTVRVEPRRLVGDQFSNQDRTMIFNSSWTRGMVAMRAPNGYVFKSLVFRPLTEGDDGRLEVRFRWPEAYQEKSPAWTPSETVDLAVARQEGLRCDAPFGSGLLIAECRVVVKDAHSGPIVVRGIEVAPTLTRIEHPGSMEIHCQDTADFVVHVDGHIARWFSGTVGPLEAGQHTVRLLPVLPGTPYGEWECPVTIEAGKTTRLIGRLPWKEGTLWGDWHSALVGVGYPTPRSSLWQGEDEQPAVQADDQTIRVIWSFEGDLWSSASTDGETFSPPWKLDLPVSSGWNESHPCLVRDESGRFILIFLSDRDAQHRSLAYVSWSRDFLHWSSPALISDLGASRSCTVFQDHLGRLILDGRKFKTHRVWISSDACHWTPEQIPGRTLTQDEPGRFCCYELTSKKQAGSDETESYRYQLSRWTSSDLDQWSAEEIVGTFEKEGTCMSLGCATQGEHGPVLILTSSDGFRTPCEPDPQGRWHLVGTPQRVWEGNFSMTHHPRWGYVVAAMQYREPAYWSPSPRCGPHVWRGPDLNPLRKCRAPLPPGNVQEPPPRKEPEWADKIAPDVTLSWAAIGKPFDVISEHWPPPDASKIPVGELVYVYAFSDRRDVMEGSRHFSPPSPGSGTVLPKAQVAMFPVGDQKVAVALDAEKADAKFYDVIRLDLTGKGDFRDALKIPRIYLCPERNASGEGKVEYEFAAGLPAMTFGGRQLAAGIVIGYEEGAVLGSAAKLSYCFSTCMVGECRFGDKVYKVRFYDKTENLDVRDPPRPLKGMADPEGPAGDEWGDWFCADCYEDGAGIIKYTNVGEDVIRYDGQAWVINRERIPQACYGNPILVDGKWWVVRVADDDRHVTAEPWTGPTATIHLDRPFWRMVLIGEESILYVYGGREPVPVPAGRYQVLEYREYLISNPNFTSPRVEMYSGRRGAIATFDLRAGATAPIAIGSPLHARMKVTQTEGALRFRFDWRDAGGRDVGFYEGEKRWQVRFELVRASDGRKIIYEAKTWEAEQRGWVIPPGHAGTWTITAEFKDTFPITVEPATFTIE